MGFDLALLSGEQKRPCDLHGPDVPVGVTAIGGHLLAVLGIGLSALEQGHKRRSGRLEDAFVLVGEGDADNGLDRGHIVEEPEREQRFAADLDPEIDGFALLVGHPVGVRESRDQPIDLAAARQPTDIRWPFRHRTTVT